MKKLLLLIPFVIFIIAATQPKVGNVPVVKVISGGSDSQTTTNLHIIGSISVPTPGSFLDEAANGFISWTDAKLTLGAGFDKVEVITAQTNTSSLDIAGLITADGGIKITSGNTLQMLDFVGPSLLSVGVDGTISLSSYQDSDIAALQTATNSLTTTSNPTNSFTPGVLYTNVNRFSFLVGTAVLNSGVSGSANITLRYTNNGTGYQLPMQTGLGVATTDQFPFNVPLATNATFTFVSTMGTGATGSLTNVVLWQH